MMRRCSEEKRVIVRVWHSKSDNRELGHISIETFNPSGYMSLWPKREFLQRNAIIIPIPSYLKKSADEDIAEEKRPADKIICFYSLDPKAIVDRFKQITDDPEFRGWTIFGENGHSCASLAYSLLNAGGIHRLVSTADRSRPSVSKSAAPDALANFALIAKKNELSFYPEIKNFGFKRAFKVSVVDQQHGHYYIEGTEIETVMAPENCCSFFRRHPYLTTGMSITAITVAMCYKMLS